MLLPSKIKNASDAIMMKVPSYTEMGSMGVLLLIKQETNGSVKLINPT